MSMFRTRRLVQGQDRTSSSTPRRNRPRNDDENDDPTRADLPPYIPMEFPLNSLAAKELQKLGNSHDTTKLEAHINKSFGFLGKSLSELADTAREGRRTVQRLDEKDQLNPTLQAQRDLLEEEAVRLETASRDLGLRAEKAVRKLVDMKADLQDSGQALTEVGDQSILEAREREARQLERNRAREREANAANGDDDGDADPTTTTDSKENIIEEPPLDQEAAQDQVRDARGRKRRQYESMTPLQRYGKDNDYIAFKRRWHEGIHGPDMILPDAEHWFDTDGNPVSIYEGDDDDDLVMEREVLSFRCALSMRDITEPYGSTKCSHVFEKTALQQYCLGSNGPVKCPETGCDAVFRWSDFSLNEDFLRRIKSARRRQAEEESDEEMDDEVGEGSEIVESKHRLA